MGVGVGVGVGAGVLVGRGVEVAVGVGVGVAEGGRVSVGVAVVTVGHDFVGRATVAGVGVGVPRANSQYPPQVSPPNRVMITTPTTATKMYVRRFIFTPPLPPCLFAVSRNPPIDPHHPLADFHVGDLYGSIQLLWRFDDALADNARQALEQPLG